MMTEMEKLVALCQQLQMGAKTPVQGKTATFQKVNTLRLCICASFCVSIYFFVCMYNYNKNESIHNQQVS